jgi:C1A family cysteine protease
MKHRYGFNPDKYRGGPPAKWFKRLTRPAMLDVSPPTQQVFSLRKGYPLPRPDQGDENSCVANSAQAIVEFIEAKEGLTVIPPSRSYLYWMARKIEGATNQDGGCAQQDMITVLNQGYCSEATMPYVPGDFTTAPSQAAIAEAAAHHILDSQYVNQDEADIKAAILQNVTPLMGGIAVYSSFESDAANATGMIPMPLSSDDLEGWHDVNICGWDDPRDLWECGNSWGPNIEDNGYFWLPKQYLLEPSLAMNLTLITKVA